MSKFKLVGAPYQQVKITPRIWMVYRDDPKNNTITVPGTRDGQFQMPMWELVEEKKKKSPKKKEEDK
jgi:hypothetical protein